MGTEIKVWEISDNHVKAVGDAALESEHLESELESWIVECPNILGEDLLIIAKQKEVQSVGRTPPVPKTSDIVAKAVVEWREHVATSLKPSTLRSVESHLRRHIVPLLGDCPLTELTVKKMQTFVTTLSSGKRKAKTIENVLLTLSSILGACQRP